MPFQKATTFIAMFCLLFCTACKTVKSPYYANPNYQPTEIQTNKEKKYSLYLIGDTGDTKNTNGQNVVLQALKKQLVKADSNSAVVFLGNQVYPKGVKKSNDKKVEMVLNPQLDILENYVGQAYFIPGNRDWNNGQSKGLKAVKRQADYIKNYFPGQDKVKFYPKNGCGDPEVKKIDKDLYLVFVDSQWWLQDWSGEKNINEGCEIKSRDEFLRRMEEIFVDHKNDQVVVMMHHPLMSNGNYGGRFSLADHIFPFRETNNFYLPLPLVGSIGPLYRSISGTQQDIVSPDYQRFIKGIEAAVEKEMGDVLFVGAHDHGLQYIDHEILKQVVSGSGSRVGYIAKGKGATFSQSARGYAVVQLYEDYEMWLEFFSVDAETGKSKMTYRKKIRNARAGTVDDEIDFPPLTNTDTVAVAGAEFKAGPLKSLFLGKQYRDIWTTPLRVPIIDLEKEKGGLTPVKKGGGMASNSLRMELANGHQYNLRSIRKSFSSIVPPAFTDLKLMDVLNDQNSANHPFGALIIPSLSEAVGVFSTQPQLVYLKHQRGLKNYNQLFPEEMYLLEERPDGDWSNADFFGNSKEIIGYTDLIERLLTKKTHYVDQDWVLKSRMFDLLIHDWDRHDDQWRWASYQQENGRTRYRPIPRDRDQAFYKFKGIIPTYLSWFVMKQFKTMKDDVKDVKHLSFNARNFDRYFLNDLEWKDWEPIIKKMQNDLTDLDIENSILGLPEEVRNIEGAELVRKLKSRRDNLLKIGKRLYDYLATEVDIPGSDDENRFDIERKSDGSVRVKMTVFPVDKEEFTKYDRIFYPGETKEIRIYGLRGEDEFNITGSDKAKIRIRIIGGADEDELNNTTGAGKLWVYDQLSGIKMKGTNIKDKTSKEVGVNDYDRWGFEYNSSIPILTFGATPDDGFWFGAAISWIQQGWRKTPYKSQQSFSFSFAPGGQDALKVSYTGHFPNAIGSLDFAPEVTIDFPRYENYFGLGNNSVFNDDLDNQFNWVRMQRIDVNPLFSISSDNENTRVDFGPVFQSHNIKQVTGRVGEDPILGFSDNALEARRYVGGTLNFTTGFMDNAIRPTNGFHLNLMTTYLNEWSLDEKVFEWEANAQFYLALLTRPQLVLANSIGYRQAHGDLQFHQYTDLGNTTNLRGYRNNRFRGDAAFFHNIDLRLFLFNWKNNVLPMGIGLIGGYDYGRVWLDEETSNEWHNSQTVGLYLDILGLAIVQPSYSFTPEGQAFNLRVGFSF